jgi:hypothetical protein
MLLDVSIAPWERPRARRVNRLLAKAEIQNVQVDSWQRSRAPNPEIQDAIRSSRNAMMLIGNPGRFWVTNDYIQVQRRALVQILAIRIWQLKHGGRFPESLSALVPTELGELPIDPFSGQSFGYHAWHGEIVRRLEDALFGTRNQTQTVPPGSWLLYSVGFDRHDDGGIASKTGTPGYQSLDLVFAIPPVEAKPNAAKEQGQSRETLKN